MPEYLKKRFGGVRLRICLSMLGLFLYTVTKISVWNLCNSPLSFLDIVYVVIVTTVKYYLINAYKDKIGIFSTQPLYRG